MKYAVLLSDDTIGTIDSDSIDGQHKADIFLGQVIETLGESDY